jgi:hypothetical protein
VWQTCNVGGFNLCNGFQGSFASMVGGKQFPCEYASGHLVDER